MDEVGDPREKYHYINSCFIAIWVSMRGVLNQFFLKFVCNYGEL